MPDHRSISNNRQNAGTPPYIGAPYNFVALNEKVVPYDQKSLPAHNAFTAPECSRQGEKLYSGEIHYTITNRTDIFIGDSTGQEFYRSINGNFAIPGSSMRGLIRGNAQILSLSSIANDVDDYKLMYRKVADRSPIGRTYSNILGVRPISLGKEKQISICSKVQAGYLIFDGESYTIAELPKDSFPQRKDSKQNYYTLRETAIIDEYLKSEKQGSINPYAYLIELADKHLMYQTDSYPFLSGGNVIKGMDNPHYCPAFYAVSFKTTNNYHVEKVGKPGELTENNCYEGYILSSGFVSKKKTHYIIPAINGIDMEHITLEELKAKKVHCIPLISESISAYKKDYEAKKNLLGATRSSLTNAEKEKWRRFFALPQKKGECRPVFYIKPEGQEKHIYFGFTPYQRLFYEHTISEGIPKAHKKTPLGYTEALFGYSKEGDNGNNSRKSRVSFEDAELKLPPDPDKLLGSLVQPMLASPKPTSYLDYLTQKEQEQVTYNSSDFTLRGYKQYWLHEKAAATQTAKKDEQGISFRPLKANNSFKGIIRFKNLYEDELGLLLWCLRLEKNSQQNIGKAKAYGYGRIQITIDDLKLLDLEKMYSSTTLDFQPYKELPSISEAIENWIQLYKNQISLKLGKDKDIMDEPSIRQFLLMKDGSKLPDNKKIRYMSVGNGDYKKRKKRLPFPEEVLGMESFQPLVKRNDNSSKKRAPGIHNPSSSRNNKT